MIARRKPIKRRGTRAMLAEFLKTSRAESMVLKIDQHNPPYHSPLRSDIMNVYAILTYGKTTQIVEWFITSF